MLDSVHFQNRTANRCVSKMWPRYVVTGGAGRLGNQMFIYASLLGIAAKNNMTPVFSGGEHPIVNTFKSLVAAKNARINMSSITDEQQVREISPWVYDSRFERLHTLSARRIRVGIFLQSWRYFDHIEPVIRRQFTFKRSYSEHATKFLNESALKNG